MNLGSLNSETKSKSKENHELERERKKKKKKKKNKSFRLIGGGGEIDKIVNSRELRECLTCALTCASLSLSLFHSVCFLCFFFFFFNYLLFGVLTVYFLFFLAPKLFFVVVLTSQQLKSWGWRWVWLVFCLFNQNNEIKFLRKISSGPITQKQNKKICGTDFFLFFK